MVRYKTLMTVLTAFRSPTFKREERNIGEGGGGGGGGQSHALERGN